MMLRSLNAAGPALVILLAGCGHDFEPPDRGARVLAAEATYDAAMFDSVTWVSDSVRAVEGNTVYAEMCRRCHGPLGLGNTDYAGQRGLEIPSLVEPAWALANLDSIRHRIFVGHEEGMPIFGSAGISAREIDGAAYYVLEVLRPDAAAADRR
jgi:mono/diheme cytochrome c family protein